MKILALYAAKNQHGNDAVGAFIPQAKSFAKARAAAGDTVELVSFDPTIADRSKRRAQILEAIRRSEGFNAWAYFGHGLRTGLPSGGFTFGSLGVLVDALHAKATKDLRIILYACSTAGAPGRDRDRLDGDGGYADQLRDRLSELGHTGWIDGHTVPGHATTNRMTRRFYLDGKAAGTGGSYLVAPGSPEWKSWGAALKDDPPFRFGFWTMTEGQIHAKLGSRAA